ncbi:hypothetical protein ARALYDRAFT_475851 [Arabidopsis lyrata subsp. lyrata]|uniref:Chaperone DnaJ C-terminal domain-containing protein n=1 Tax=Arabidopsis lyrata subsp. lyrata TaxID=81972 RepID=D7KVK6_ARALL|nr:hypothetical protein ARALYDRAFT_475851 [Arabidopsis lyrata subsp. lyrata]
MATQGMAQPSAKKRSFLLRDIFKLCRSISRVFPRDKPKHHHHKAKHETKLFKGRVPGDNNNKVEGVSLCKVRSYRFDNTNTNFNTATATGATTNPTFRSLSFIGRSKSSSNRMTESGGFMPTLMRSTTTVPRSFANPILYSSSSAKVAKPSPTEKKLRCTLEELCNGCTKKIKITRDVITSSGQMCEEEETVEIKVKPGWKGGTKVTFEGNGEKSMRCSKEKEMTSKWRAVEVSLLEALTGCELSIAYLDGDNMSLRIEDVIHPGYVTVVQGKGMPNLKEKGKRGDLRVRFRTKFPQHLTDEQRAEIHSILQDSS